MQSVLSRIWTRVAVSISCDDSHFTTGTSTDIAMLSIIWKSNLINQKRGFLICVYVITTAKMDQIDANEVVEF